MDDVELGRLAERDYQTWVEGFAASPGVRVSRTDVLARKADVRHEYLTGVFGAWFPRGDADARIRAVIADLGRDGRPFTWSVWPSDTPHDLVARLVAAGFEDEGAGPVMARDLTHPTALDEPPPDGLVVRDATSESDVATIAAFALGSLGDVDPGVTIFGDTLARVADEPQPRLRLFGGWLDDDLVASSGLFTGSGVAGIYAVATDEAHRGRGFGRALTVAAMRVGRDLGLETSVLLASDLGEPVYRRLGFRPVGEVRFLRWPGGLPADDARVR
jgi:GNAT superfamily N-acetyltransferase